MPRNGKDPFGLFLPVHRAIQDGTCIDSLKWICEALPTNLEYIRIHEFTNDAEAVRERAIARAKDLHMRNLWDADAAKWLVSSAQRTLMHQCLILRKRSRDKQNDTVAQSK